MSKPLAFLSLLLILLTAPLAYSDDCTASFSSDLMGVDLVPELFANQNLTSLKTRLRVIEEAESRELFEKTFNFFNFQNHSSLDLTSGVSSEGILFAMTRALPADVAIILTPLKDLDAENAKLTGWAFSRFRQHGIMVSPVGAPLLDSSEDIYLRAQALLINENLSEEFPQEYDVLVPTENGDQNAALILGGAVAVSQSLLWDLNISHVRKLLELTSLNGRSLQGSRILNLYRLYKKSLQLSKMGWKKQTQILNMQGLDPSYTYSKKEIKEIQLRVQNSKTCDPILLRDLRKKYFDTQDTQIRDLLAQAYLNQGYALQSLFISKIGPLSEPKK